MVAETAYKAQKKRKWEMNQRYGELELELGRKKVRFYWSFI